MTAMLLAALVLASPAPLSTQEAGAKYADLVAGYAEETAEYRKPGAKVPPLLPDVSPYHARFLAAAKEYEGTPDELAFLGWVLQNAPRNEEAHAAAVAALDALAAKTTEVPDEKAFYKESRDAVQQLKYNKVSDGVFAETLLQAKVLTALAKDEAIRAASAHSVYKLENLQVGMVAPDIVGQDLDGVGFRLSEYRGKVVVIDFWGDW